MSLHITCLIHRVTTVWCPLDGSLGNLIFIFYLESELDFIVLLVLVVQELDFT